MALPSPTDAQIKSDQPLDEALVKDGYRDSDAYNFATGPNGGSGIAANVSAFATAFGPAGHRHDGTDGQGENIDTAGIANGAASLEPMFQDNCVSAAKIAANTLQGSDFDTMAVTAAKMSGVMGSHASGTKAYDSLAAPDTGAGDVTFLGDRAVFGNPKGSIGVICRQKATASGFVDYFVVSQSGGITLGFNYDPLLYPPSGTWDWDFWVV